MLYRCRSVCSEVFVDVFFGGGSVEAWYRELYYMFLCRFCNGFCVGFSVGLYRIRIGVACFCIRVLNRVLVLGLYRFWTGYCTGVWCRVL